MDERRTTRVGRRGGGRLRRTLVLLTLVIGVLGVFPVQPAEAEIRLTLRPSPDCGEEIPRPADMKIQRSIGGIILRPSPTWTCTFVDHFTRGLNRDTWHVQTTATSDFTHYNKDCFLDRPENVRVEDGNLLLSAVKEPTFTCHKTKGKTFETQFSGGEVISKAFSQTYGRFEVSAAMPPSTGPGYHFAFWLWPETPKYPVTIGGGWENGELDVVEWYSKTPGLGVPYIHYHHQWFTKPDGTFYSIDPNITAWGPNCWIANPTAYNKYVLEWSSTTIRMLINDKVCLENKNWTPLNTSMPGPFDQPFRVALAQTIGSTADNAPNSTTPFPGTAKVDYIKAWQ